ncbi:MAG: Fe-S cluster assembly protein SufD [Phycisphaerales bacterium]
MTTAATPTSPSATGTIRLSEPDSVRSAMPTGGPDWLSSLRTAGAEQYASLGLPTRRDEEWRYTSLRALESVDFDANPVSGTVTSADVDRLAIPGVVGPRLVFVDGRYDASLSSVDGVPANVIVCSLIEAIDQHADAVRSVLGTVADDDDHAFVSLNAALMRDGVFVHVPDDITVERPIYVLSISTGATPGALGVRRNLMVVGAGASVTVVEDHCCLDDSAVYLNNVVTEMTVGDRGFGEHMLIERESMAAFNICALKTKQGSDSNVESHAILLGGRIVRNDVNPKIAGTGSDSLLNGLYVPIGEQHMDNHMRVEHLVGECTSRQYYRGMLGDETTGVFSGRIVVSDGAAETDAIQSCQNLLLSGKARAITKPQLEIYDADVQCTHGATTGQVEPEHVHYLRARGIPEAEAKGLLVYAFASEGIDRIRFEPVRDWVNARFRERLPYASNVDDVAWEDEA